MARNVYITYSYPEYQNKLICKPSKLSIQVVIYTSLIAVLFYNKIKHKKTSYTSLLHIDIITSPKAQSFIRTLRRVLLNWQLKYTIRQNISWKLHLFSHFYAPTKNTRHVGSGNLKIHKKHGSSTPRFLRTGIMLLNESVL